MKVPKNYVKSQCCLAYQDPSNTVCVRCGDPFQQANGAECVCENHTDNDGWRCNVCGLLSPHRQPTDVPTKGVYCRNCEDTIEYNEMKPFRRDDDDAVDMLCPGCDVVLVEGE